VRPQLFHRFRCALLLACALTLGGASGEVSAQNDDAELAALRAQLEQIRLLVGSFDERLKALELARRAPATVVPVAPSASTADLKPTVAASSQSPVASSHQEAQAGAATGERVHTPPSDSSITAAPDRQAWRKLGSGATQADVRRLLGPPTTTFQLSGKTVWYYYYPGKGAGSVFFDSAGRASSVQSPSSGW
jgi:hypothetical protein